MLTLLFIDGYEEMRFIYLAFTLVLAFAFMIVGEDTRSDIYTAAAFIMAYIEFRGSK